MTFLQNLASIRLLSNLIIDLKMSALSDNPCSPADTWPQPSWPFAITVWLTIGGFYTVNKNKLQFFFQITEHKNPHFKAESSFCLSQLKGVHIKTQFLKHIKGKSDLHVKSELNVFFPVSAHWCENKRTLGDKVILCQPKPSTGR